MKLNKKIGLYFGTFNPIHIGHIAIGNHMVNDTDLDEVWFVVSPHNPLKNIKTLLDDSDRLELANIAVQAYDKLYVSDIEFGLSRPSYTINTLVYLNEKYPQMNFSVIIGGDNLSSFHKWKNYEAIIENHDVYVYPRFSTTPGAIDNHKKVKLIDAPLLQISSSLIRDGIKNKKDMQAMLPQAVWQYINEMNFYKK